MDDEKRLHIPIRISHHSHHPSIILSIYFRFYFRLINLPILICTAFVLFWWWMNIIYFSHLVSNKRCLKGILNRKAHKRLVSILFFVFSCVKDEKKEIVEVNFVLFRNMGKKTLMRLMTLLFTFTIHIWRNISLISFSAFHKIRNQILFFCQI